MSLVMPEFRDSEISGTQEQSGKALQPVALGSGSLAVAFGRNDRVALSGCA
jgi:hypothetical protein